MIEKNEAVAVLADWLVPVDSDPIPDGFLVVDQGTIRFVGRTLPATFHSIQQVRLPGFAIVPGLVNSHCHLEFSDLQAPIPVGKSFPDWIRSLLAFRRSKNGDPERLASDRQAAIASGIRESYQAGVRWVVDMATEPWSAAWIEKEVASISAGSPIGFAPKEPIVVQPCVELLDIVEHRFEATLALAEKQRSAPKSIGLGRIGFAPHAPYTASRKVLQWCTNLPREEQRLVTMHLAESSEEQDWLQHRNGPFAELLGPIMGETYFERTAQVTEHVALLSKAWRATIAHGNYLSQQDLMSLAEQAATLGVVHCPRTHQHFGHLHPADPQLTPTHRYPLGERIGLGVRHFLGTDSRASNPDLNLWTEAKQVRAEHTELSSHQVLKMITTDAAEFLDIENRYGSIRVGQPSALTAIKIDNAIPSDALLGDMNKLYDILLESHSVSAPLESVVSDRLS